MEVSASKEVELRKLYEKTGLVICKQKQFGWIKLESQTFSLKSPIILPGRNVEKEVKYEILPLGGKDHVTQKLNYFFHCKRKTK